MKSTSFDDMQEDEIIGFEQVPYTSLGEPREDFQTLVEEVQGSFSRYLRKRPLVATGLVFLAGFYMGWKVKPW